MNSEIVEIKELNHADRDASVKLVSIDGQNFILKTDDVREVAAQRYFNQQLEQHGIPALLAHAHVDLRPNQILLEYIEGSITLGVMLSEERCRAWGKLVAQVHAIKASTFTVLDADGKRVSADWSTYIRHYTDRAVARHKALPYSLGNDLIDKVRHILEALIDLKPTEFSVTHGDLHIHNVLMKGETPILFDKFADFLVAPAAFDLGVIYAEAFSGAAFPELGFTTDEQQRYFKAFTEGYGPLGPEQQQWLDHFTLLRAFYRWPNRFAQYSGETIRLLARKLS